MLVLWLTADAPLRDSFKLCVRGLLTHRKLPIKGYTQGSVAQWNVHQSNEMPAMLCSHPGMLTWGVSNLWVSTGPSWPTQRKAVTSDKQHT